jgi:predicted amidophosphoribosyltransferase
VLDAIRTAVLDALAVLAPVECAGCGAPDRAVCADCRGELNAAEPVLVALDGVTVPVLVALPYAGVARAVLLAFKDAGRTDVARHLAVPLLAALAAALRTLPPGLAGEVELVAIPSTRAAYRRRGYAPVSAILLAAGLRGSRLLRLVRQTRDQAGLTERERAENRVGSLAARPIAAGRTVVVVDDIVTSGATLREAIRALESAGAHVAAAVAVARTERRHPKPAHGRET